MSKRLLALLAYAVPTFALGYVWHLVTFASYYKSLEVYRDEVLIPAGLISILVQGIAWSGIYQRTFAGEKILAGATKFASLAFPIAWSYMVVAVAAKHPMSSVSGYLVIETAFVLVHYAIVSPLIAAVYARPAKA